MYTMTMPRKTKQFKFLLELTKYFISNIHNKKWSLIDWMNDPNDKWDGKEKQESAFRIFAVLGFINKLNGFIPTTGNINKGEEIKKLKCKHDIWYSDNKQISLNDKGTKSDLTMVSKNNKKHFLLTTSKNYKKITCGQLDIRDINDIFNKHYKQKGYSYDLCIVVRDRAQIENMKIESTNHDLKERIKDDSTIIIDQRDLQEAWYKFKNFFINHALKDIMDEHKNSLNLYLHQKYCVYITISHKNDGVSKILWCHIMRSGKSYIMMGTVSEDSREKQKCNYLIITAAPNETKAAYQNIVSNYLDFNGFHCYDLSNDKKFQNNCPTTEKNIFIVSIQWLRHNSRKTTYQWMKEINFDIRFFDEAHYGGATELAINTLKQYSSKSFTVYMTATYDKPAECYNIPQKYWIKHTMEDICLLKSIRKSNHKELFIKNHPGIEEIVNQYDDENIEKHYGNFPEFCMLTWDFKDNTKQQLIMKTKNNDWGFSMEGLFLGNWDETKNMKKENAKLQNEDNVLNMIRHIFGNKGEFGIEEYPNNFMKRIIMLARNKNSREVIGTKENPSLIMAFLPEKNVKHISSCLKKLLEERHKDFHPETGDYGIIIVNTDKNGNTRAEKVIENAKRTGNKKMYLVLSGRQLSLGVTLPYCDVVFMLNNGDGHDKYFQMMFRGMSPESDKKLGYVVDLNMHRAINVTVDYSIRIGHSKNIKECIHYVLRERLINLNSDMMTFYQNNEEEMLRLTEEQADKINTIWSTNCINSTRNIIDTFSKIWIEVDDEMNDKLKIIFDQIEQPKTKKKTKKEENVKKGIEKIKVGSEVKESKESNEIKEEKKNFMDILKHIIPLVCILTINYEETNFMKMFEIIQNDHELFNILIDRIKSWWGDKIEEKLIKELLDTFNITMGDNTDIINSIAILKQVFRDNVHDKKAFSKLVDEYFTPQLTEKDNLAEITTHYELRQEMLDTIDQDFWTTPKKVLEPSSGKGQFVMDIYDKFMTGLETMYPDELERHRVILEDCLYFADINKANIFITELLLDDGGEIKVNSYCGDSLAIDIKQNFNVEKFDMIIGNPPYNVGKDSIKDSRMNAVYHRWVYKFHPLTNKLLFITPSKWFLAGTTDGLDEFREYMREAKLKFIKHFPNDDVFPGVQIKGGVSYFMLDDDHVGPVKFNGIDMNISKYDIIPESKYIPIIDQLFINDVFQNGSLEDMYCAMGTYTPNSKFERDEINSNSDGMQTPLRISISQLAMKKYRVSEPWCYIDGANIKRDYEFYKVVTQTAAHGPQDGMKDVLVFDETQIHNRSYISFCRREKEGNKIKLLGLDRDEAISLAKYMRTKFVNVMVSARKKTHNMTSADVFSWIPMVPLDRDWTDHEVNQYLNFSDDVIGCINTIASNMKGAHNVTNE